MVYNDGMKRYGILKTFSLIAVAIVLALSVTAQTSSAATPMKKGSRIFTQYESYRMVYRVTDSSKDNPEVACIATYGFQQHIEVPAKIKVKGVKYKVTSIGKNAFRGYSPATSITIGKNVTAIGDNAFKNCNNLELLKCPSRVLTSLGEGALEGCDKLNLIITKTDDVQELFKSAAKAADLSLRVQ